jgi:tRNA(Ile2)-agmatinylcytidine synthase
MVSFMRIAIDDTDSPEGMCTTYLGAVLIRRLEDAGYTITDRLLVRLNPNVKWKTRGNAAVCIEVEGGEPERAFAIASDAVDEFADLGAENTHPGLVVAPTPLSPDFYHKAVTGFCTLEEAKAALKQHGALYRGWKLGRGLIGATAAASADFSDWTYELLAYRDPAERGVREVVQESLFISEENTFPHTWDTVDRANDCIVCFPHTPDPVLFGIRGESTEWVLRARSYVISEEPVMEEIFRTNQGTDAHLIDASLADVEEGLSYRVTGTVATTPETGQGGHVTFELEDADTRVTCMAYEPTKGFRDVVRSLAPGDELLVTGSYKNGSINLEKVHVITCLPVVTTRPPLCPECGRRMKSDGKNKGWKCRRCRTHSNTPETVTTARTVTPGWYEVPPSARRHLARPLCRKKEPASQ